VNRQYAKEEGCTPGNPKMQTSRELMPLVIVVLGGEDRRPLFSLCENNLEELKSQIWRQ
jgi:hypothetical protein